jgi:hypothetical protein
MLKKFILLLLLFSASFCFSQEIVTSIPLELKNKAAFQVVNDSLKQAIIFLGDKLRINAIRLDQNMQPLDSLPAAKPEKAYDMMVGYNVSGTNPRLFWSSSDHEQIYSQFYDFEKKAVSGISYSIPFKEDRFLQFFSEQDKFYILSIIRKSNTLKLYVFDNSGKMEEHLVDLGAAKFFDHNYKPTNLYGSIGDDFFEEDKPYILQLIKSENPVSLTESSKKRKCYLNGKQIFITLDTNVDYTQVVNIDLAAFKGSEKVIQQPYIAFMDRGELNSNSFIIDRQIYQFKTSSQKMFLSIKDLNGNLIKEYSKTPDENIDFKNSEIIQETGDIENPRILQKTAQFLRKANNQFSGISISKINGNYLVTLGSVSEERMSTGAVIGTVFLGGVTGVIIVSALWNPAFDSFNSYNNRKVVYINCLFDKNAKHIDGALQPLAFDKIRKFTKEMTDYGSPTLFKMDHAYYFGYYSKTEKKYLIRKFNE